MNATAATSQLASLLLTPPPAPRRFRVVKTVQCPHCRRVYTERSVHWCQGCGSRLTTRG
ncbi:MAG: hypothetical protein HPY69_20125 [Armatimonadetes bacterium]|nr:hypothetical protein [Armatimonadota bacterium]